MTKNKTIKSEKNPVKILLKEIKKLPKTKKKGKFVVWSPETLEKIDFDGKIMPSYKAVLDMAGNKYEGEGETLFDALDSIVLEWQQIKAKGVFTITCGDKKCEHLFTVLPLRRIFTNKLTKQLWARNLERLMETAGDVKCQ